MRPARGRVLHDGVDFWAATADEQTQLQRRFGLLFQQGALWSSLTLIENVALPLAEFTTLDRHTIHDIAALKLALVGLAGYEDYMPAEISGGMRKRAALARAMALDPEILFFDEPSAGLDPVTSRRLDDLILEINASLGTTVVLVTHELPSIFAIANDGIFLDAQAQTLIAQGAPAALMDSGLPAVQAFLTRSAA